jgi:hypothetical protein
VKAGCPLSDLKARNGGMFTTGLSQQFTPGDAQPGRALIGVNYNVEAYGVEMRSNWGVCFGVWRVIARVAPRVSVKHVRTVYAKHKIVKKLIAKIFQGAIRAPTTGL